MICRTTLANRTPRTAGVHRGFAGWRLALLLTAVVSSGASCPQLVDQYKVPVARVLPEQPSLEQVMTVVNENSARIESLYTTDATIKVAMFPKLRANIAFERQRRFRLFAETALTGTAVDLGSNDQLFWFSTSQSRPPALYYCRHDEFAESNARRVMAVEPQWLVEALGVVSFDPRMRHHGPYPHGDGKLEIRSEMVEPNGPWSKRTIVDAARGWVLEQHVVDATGRSIASAIASEHQRDPLTNVTLPHQIDVQWPAMELSMKINIGELTVNGTESPSGQLYTLPEYNGWQKVDLARAQLPPPNPAMPTPGGELPNVVPPPSVPQARGFAPQKMTR